MDELNETKVKLNRGMTGNYGWEISSTKTVFDEGARKGLTELDDWLIKKFISNIDDGGEEDGD